MSLVGGGLVMPHMLIDPQRRTPAEAGGVGLQSTAAMGPHGVPRGFCCGPARRIVAPSKRNCPDRPADPYHPNAGCTPSRCAQECHRLATFAASACATGCRDPRPGASITSTTTRPWRDHPTPRAASNAITGLYVEHQTSGCSHAHQMEALQTVKRVTPITTVPEATQSSRVGWDIVRGHERSGWGSYVRDLFPPPTNTLTHTPTRKADLRLGVNFRKGRGEGTHEHSQVAMASLALGTAGPTFTQPSHDESGVRFRTGGPTSKRPSTGNAAGRLVGLAAILL